MVKLLLLYIIFIKLTSLPALTLHMLVVHSFMSNMSLFFAESNNKFQILEEHFFNILCALYNVKLLK